MPNYQGIGLPSRFYDTVVDYLRQSSSDVGNTLVCNQTGICSLPLACANYPTLWDLSFQIESQLLGSTENP